MLKKIISIQNIGRFRNSQAAGDQFLSRHTLILGSNGSGKSTACAILRSLKLGDPSLIVGRTTLGSSEPPFVKLLTSDGILEFTDSDWTSTFPNIEIFDSTFVSENIFTGDLIDIVHRRNLYHIVVGDQGVRLAEKESTLDRNSRDLALAIRQLEAELDTRLPQGLSRDEFSTLPNDELIVENIDEQLRLLAALEQSHELTTREQLHEVTLPVFPEDFRSLLLTTIEDIADDAERHISDHLRVHGMSNNDYAWLAQGMQHIDQGTCPFCGQDITPAELVSHYRAVFSENYETLRSRVTSMRKSISENFSEEVLADLLVLDERNKGSFEFWSDYCSIGDDPPQIPKDLIPALRSLRNSAIDFLSQKARGPTEPIVLPDDFANLENNFHQSTSSITRLAERVQSINEIIQQTQSVNTTKNLTTEQRRLRILRAQQLRHSEPIAKLYSALALHKTQKDDIETQKRNVRTELEQHADNMMPQYQDEINAYLDAFNADFRLTHFDSTYTGGRASSQYRILINDVPVRVGNDRTPPTEQSFRNTLSAGDRTTLALAFFLTQLGHDSDLADKIVVFDDPFSSQDSFRRQQTVYEIVKTANKCAQVIVLSHDATFLKKIWDKAPPSERKTLNLVNHSISGSRIMPIDLESSCQGRTASDIDDLQAYVALGRGNPTDIVRKMRTVLEHFCWTSFPSHFDPGSDVLGTILQKIRAGGNSHPATELYEDIDEINDYTAPYHHGEDTVQVSAERLDESELIGFTRRTLRLTKNLQA